MIISSNIFLKELSVHRIVEEGLLLSKTPISLDDDFIKEVLIKYFFSSFKDDKRFCFDLQYSSGDVCHLASEIFQSPETLHLNSKKLAEVLYGNSDHPSIRPGDLFVVYAEDCVLDDEIVEVIGIFKTENKETYLKLTVDQDLFELESEQGININKVDKGALIFNTEKENGYVVLSIDNITRNGQAQFWNEGFLNLKPLENQFYETQQLVNLCQDFISEAVPEEDKVDKIALFNSSMDYLKSNDTYSHEDYKEQVLQEPELIASYDQFRGAQSEQHAAFQKDEIDISKPAVKQSKKHIRSVIKLDKNFHVYVHGNRENIQKGFDSGKQKNYYKLYFEEEQ